MAESRYYLDTSALLPYYRQEDTSDEIQNFLSSVQPPIYISYLTEVEFFSAVSRLVRMKEVTEVHARLIEDAFAEDIRSGLFIKVSLAKKHYKLAVDWISSRKTGLRTLDGLHLACSFLYDTEMVTCDEILAKSAARLGIPCRFIGH